MRSFIQARDTAPGPNLHRKHIFFFPRRIPPYKRSTKILNLTQHELTEEQKKDGIAEPGAENREQIVSLLNFCCKPDAASIRKRATVLARMAEEEGAEGVMLGGAPYLMPALVESMRERGLRVFFSYSPRVSIERTRPDGGVEKVSVFRYQGLFEIE